MTTNKLKLFKIKTNKIILFLIVLFTFPLLAAQIEKQQMKTPSNNVVREVSSSSDLLEDAKNFKGYLCHSTQSKIKYSLNINTRVLKAFAKENEESPYIKTLEISDVNLFPSRKNTDDFLFSNWKAGMTKNQIVKFYIDKKPNKRGYYEAQYVEDENIICRKK